MLNIFIVPVYADTIIYKVAGDKNFPPYEYIDDDGIYKGFNVDMLNAISLVTDMNFIFRPMKWEDAYNSIENGEADLIQGMKESENRKEEFLFSESLLLNSQSIFVLEDNRNILGKEDLSGATVGIMKEDIVRVEISQIKDIDILEHDSLEQSLKSLLNNRVDAIIGNTLTMNYVCKELNCIEKVKIVGDSFNEQKYAIAVSKDNHELLDELNKGLDIIQKNGIYDSLYRKWFGTPIKNTRENSNFYLKIVILMGCGIIFIFYVFKSINNNLKKIIETKTEEHKLLVNELRRYDKMQFMDKIMSSVAHEIRNPLTSIKIYTSQFKNKIDNKEFLLAAAEDIPIEIDRIDGLIKEFMEYTSPRQPVVERINLYEELFNSIKLVKLEMKYIKLIINVDKDIFINFDRNHFKQIILNILLNSKEAIKGINNPKIAISTFKKEDRVQIIFQDNGYGMNEEDLDHIFEPFYTTKATGNGLGMFIVKQLVKDNTGDIIVMSKVDNGTTIIISVKRGDIDEKQVINS